MGPIKVDTQLGQWMAACILLALYVLHSVDRYVIGVVLEPLRHEFNLSDTQLGAVGGLAHALAYSVFVLPMGMLLDRSNRVKLVAAMLAIWSLVTGLGALATGFWFLFLMRMGVGAAESSTSPATQSLIASIFPLKRRASAMGFVFSGTAIGTGLVFAVGGPVAEHWGWRAVFLLACIPGLILAAVMWFGLKEPPRHSEGLIIEPPASLPKTLAVFGRNPAIYFSAIGATIAAMNIASVWTWISPVLIREHNFGLAEAGIIVGIAAGLVKFASGMVSGFLGDFIAKGRLERLWIVPSCALALSVPVGFAIVVAPSPLVAIGLVMLLGFTMGTHYAAPKTIIMSVSPPNMRGSISATEQLMVNLVGVAAGPLITGIISDKLGGQSVSLALAVMLSINLLAAASFWAASLFIPKSAEGVMPNTPATNAPPANAVPSSH